MKSFLLPVRNYEFLRSVYFYSSVSIDQYHKLTVHLVYFGPTRLLSQACRLYVDVACFCSMVRMSVGHMGKLCVIHSLRD